MKRFLSAVMVFFIVVNSLSLYASAMENSMEDYTIIESSELQMPSINSIDTYTSGIVVKWSYVSGSQGYCLYRMAETEEEWTLLTTTTDLAYQDTDTVGGISYIYGVTSYITSDSTIIASEKAITDSIVAYPAQTEITSLNILDGSVIVKWTAVEGAASYTLYRQAENESSWSQVASGIETTEYMDITVKGAITYTYALRVTSVDSEGKTWHSAWSFTDETVCLDLVVADVSEVSVSSYTSGIIVRWSSVSGATGYNLYRMAEDEEEWKFLTTTTDLTYQDTDTVGGKSYIYAAEAYAVSNSITSTSEKTISNSIVAYPGQTEITGLSIDDGAIVVTWTAVEGAASYTLYRKADTDTDWTQVASGIEATEYTDGTAKGAITYTYALRVTSVDSEGKTWNSAWSFTDETVCLELLIGNVDEISAVSYTSGIIIRWSSVPGATGYHLYQRAEDEENWKLLTTTTDLAYQDIETIGGKSYTYAVEAYVISNDVTTISEKIISDMIVAYPMTPTVIIEKYTQDYVEIAWNEIDGAEKYTLYRCIEGSDLWEEIITTENLNYRDVSALQNISYVYAVKILAYDKDKNEIYSAFGFSEKSVILEKKTGWYDVTDEGFEADGSDSEDDTEAIQYALNKAQNATDSNPVTVHVPAGDYYISRALTIYSNTSLILHEEANIIRSDESSMMLYSVHLNESGAICIGRECTHENYTQARNITIQGGTWDGNISNTTSYATQLFSFAHVENLTIIDTELKNSCGPHMINIDAVSGLHVENVTFRNFLKYTGSDPNYYGGENIDPLTHNYYGKEALHIDFISEDSDISASPLTRLACENVVVTNCQFINCVSGVGTHNVFEELYTDNVQITNNTFTDIACNSINAVYFTNLTVTGNKASNTDVFILLNGSSGTVSNNTASGIVTSGITIKESSVSVSENILNFAKEVDERGIGISLTNLVSSTINNNTITAAPYMGIYASECQGEVEIKKNIISDSDYGIFISNADADLKVYSNSIRLTGINGIYATGSTNIQIAENRITNVSGNGISLAKCEALELYKNTIFKVDGAGINAVESSHLFIKENEISDCITYGIAVRDCLNIIINNNITVDNTIYDIAVTGTSSGEITDNTIAEKGIYSVDNMTVKNNGRSITYCTIQMPGSQAYTGNAIEPEVIILNGTEELKVGEDFEVTYENNIDFGTAAIIITGTGIYKGTVSGTFSIIMGKPLINSITASASGISVSWESCAGADYYTLYRQADGGSWTIAASNLNVTTYVDAKVTAGITYTYALKSHRVDNGTEISSEWSGTELTATAIAIALTPENPVITSMTASSSGIKVSWDKAKNAEYYTLYRQAAGGSWTVAASNLTATSYVDTNVIAGTTYTYALKSHRVDNDTELTSGWSGTTLMVTAVALTPENPVITSMTASSSGIKVSWDKAKNAEYYTLYRQAAGGSWTVAASNLTATSYVDTNVIAGITYTYALKSHRVDNDTELTSGWSGTTLMVTAVALTPENPVITNMTASSSGIKVSWDKAKNAEYYTLYRQAAGGSWTVAASNLTATSYVDTNVIAGITYTYALKSHRVDNGTELTSGWSGTTLMVTAVALTPENPVITSMTASSSGIKVSWNKAKNAEYYTLYRQAAGGSWTVAASNLTATSYVDTNVIAGITYTYALKSHRVDNDTELTSGWSGTTLMVTAVALTPENPVITSMTASSSGIKVSWDKAKNAEYYTLYRQAAGGSWTVAASNLTATSYVDTNVIAGITYTYALKSHRVDNDTELTSGWSGTTLMVTAVALTPENPVITSMTASSSGIKVSWNKAKNAEYYTLYRQAAGGSWTVAASNLTATSYVDTNVIAGTTYTYALKSHRIDNGTELTSGWSGTILTVVAIPVNTEE